MEVGSKPLGLCHIGVCCFVTGALGLELQGLSVNTDAAALVWDLAWSQLWLTRLTWPPRLPGRLR